MGCLTCLMPSAVCRLHSVACVLFISILFYGGSSQLQADEAPRFNRRVLILDFVNQRKNLNADYLAVTIAEALIDPLKKTGKFEILPRSGGTTFNESEAIAKGIEAQADVVVIGNFVAILNIVQIQAKAIDVGEKRLALSKSRTTPLNATIFDNINALAGDMTREMAEKLPPLAQRVVIHEGTAGDFIARSALVHAYFSGSPVWGKESAYVSIGMGASMDISFQFLHRFLQPYFAANVLFASGKERISKMSFFGADGGLAARINLGHRFCLTPAVGGGFQSGKIQAAFEISYLVPAVFGGLSADLFFSDKFSFSAAIKQYVLVENDTALKVLSMQIGVGYRI